MKKNFIFFTALLIGLSFTSCEKDIKGDEKSILSELAAEKNIVNVNSTDYERVVVGELSSSDVNSPYAEGMIEYRENGELTASIDFAEGGADKAQYMGKGGDKIVALKKKGGKYIKVIVEPLVQSDNCDYIIAGIIKFYDIKTEEWLATFDYGDGSCDHLIDKTTIDGSSTFSLTDYPEWN